MQLPVHNHRSNNVQISVFRRNYKHVLLVYILELITNHHVYHSFHQSVYKQMLEVITIHF